MKSVEQDQVKEGMNENESCDSTGAIKEYLISKLSHITHKADVVASNSLKTIFTRLQKASVLGQLESLGVNVKDFSSGDSLPVIQILKNLAASFGKFSDTQRLNILELIAGVYQINVLKVLLGYFNNPQSNHAENLGATN